VAVDTAPAARRPSIVATWQDVERLVAALPGVVEGTSYGGRAWKAGGKPVTFGRGWSMLGHRRRRKDAP
jgi:hypothetical protein